MIDKRLRAKEFLEGKDLIAEVVNYHLSVQKAELKKELQLYQRTGMTIISNVPTIILEIPLSKWKEIFKKE